MGTGKCIVVITDETITVEYDLHTQRRRYNGNDLGGGHYKLVAATHKGAGNLHRFQPNGLILDGWCSEGGEKGMWRIYLRGEQDEDSD